MVETNKYLIAILMIFIFFFASSYSIAQGVKGRDGGNVKGKETRGRGEKKLKVSGITYNITVWDSFDEKRFIKSSADPPQNVLVIPAAGAGIADVKLALNARRLSRWDKPLPDTQDNIRKVTEAVKKLMWKIEPLNPSTASSPIRIPSGAFRKWKDRHKSDSFGNYIASTGTPGDRIYLKEFLKNGIHRFKLSVGPGKDRPDGGVEISSPFTAEILVIDIKLVIVESEFIENEFVFKKIDNPYLIENNDFDEGKKKAGKFLPDDADASPMKADGTSYAPHNFLDLNASVHPNDEDVLAGATLTFETRGLGGIRILSLKGDRLFRWKEVPLSSDVKITNLTQDYFSPNGLYDGWFLMIEGIKPGTVDLELKYKMDGTEVARTVKLDVRRADCETKQHGQHILELCSEECTHKYWSWSFFTTNYNVSKTWGLGEHQGIFIIGNEYFYDKRFSKKDSIIKKWTKGKGTFNEIVESPYSSDKSKKPPKMFADKAICEHQRVKDNDNFIYNHGRTVAQKPIKGKGILIKQMNEFSIGPLEYEEWSKFGRRVLNREATATQSCIKAITDGFCDSVCGNCSYVLPSKGIGDKDKDNKIDGQKEVFSISEGDPKRKVDYYRTCFDEKKGRKCRGKGGVDKDKQPKWKGKPFPYYNDPFTHCADKTDGAKLPQQGLSTKWAKVPSGFADRFITGLYGHNSNTDAEAEYQQFNACKDNPDTGPDEACKVCGENHKIDDKIQQWPCVDIVMGENNADSKWFRTDGLHNIDDITIGNAKGGRNPVPKCSTNGQEVRGM